MLLYFDNCNRLKIVQLGYLKFKTKLYIPRQLRFFNFNGFDHVAEHCKGKVCCSTCSAAHESKNCIEINLKCSNYGGNHSATSKHSPRYFNEAETIKIKTVEKLSYAKACIETKLINEQTNYHITQNLSDLAYNMHFPPLPKSTGTIPIFY